MKGSLSFRCLGEALGTAALVGLGTGAIVEGAQHGGSAPLLLALAWFAAVAIPVVALASRTGAHLNPAVTAALALGRRFPAREVPPYFVAQLTGAFAGSFLVWGTIGDGARLGATVPRGIPWETVFLLEFAFTALLLGSVLVLTGLPRSPRKGELLLPAGVVGLSTYLIGPWTGSSLNPARSLAPGLLSGDTNALFAYLLAAVCAAGLMGVLARALLGTPGPAGVEAAHGSRPPR